MPLNKPQTPGRLYVVGIGPGGPEHLTPAAARALQSADTIVGYRTYLDLITPFLTGRNVLSSGMRQEVDRCREALKMAADGQVVALVSGGDAGIYGMAGLALELAGPDGPEVEVIPAISAVQAAAARLGAPLMHDFAVISLSDLLTPFGLICQRLDAAAAADFVITLYNPRSKGRPDHLDSARRILLRHRAGTTPVGIVRHATREEETVQVSTLADFDASSVDMFSIVIIGNSQTLIDAKGRMLTPRGYNVRSEAKGVRRAPLTPHPSPLTDKQCAALFIGGTGSDVGKSVITAGLCRLLARRGVDVAPFKAQNMALNSAVTPDGGEIGRAQALQAAACGLEPQVDMNPVLLKPTSHTGSQVIIGGRPVGNMSVTEYHAYKPTAFAAVQAAFGRLAAQHDVIVMEGAGSIAEINLRAHDITNLRAAQMAQAPVLLVADIDRGGVFAAIVGTLQLLTVEERRLVRGVIINRFRGDPSLLTSGLREIEERTGVPVLGVVPWLDLHLPEEDSVALGRKPTRPSGNGALRIGVVRLPHISNYTDFDPLEREPGVDLFYLNDPALVAGCDLLLLPGSKSTLADLAWLQKGGLAAAIADLHAAGGTIAGICGGYQMLGLSLSDPQRSESELTFAAGLGLLAIDTVLEAEKQTHQVQFSPLPAASDCDLAASGLQSGYEIHLGMTRLDASMRPLFSLRRSADGRVLDDGAVSTDGRVWGSYLHGLFDNAALRQSLLVGLCRRKGIAPPPASTVPTLTGELDRLADHLEQHLNLAAIFALLPAMEGR